MKSVISFAGSWKSARFALAFALLFAVGSFGFYACTNNKGASEEVKPAKIVRVNKNLLVNPYNYVGVNHNQGLLYIAQQPDFGSQSITRIVELSRDFALSRGYTALPDSTFTNISNQVSTRISNTNNLTLTVAGNDYNLSLIVKSALQEIEAIIQNGTNVQNSLSVSANIQTVTTNLRTLEQTLLARNYTQVERAEILPVISVAIHSSEFWNDANENPQNPYYPIMLQRKGFWWWLGFIGKVILADAVGAAVGGAVGGGLGGPGGATCGAVIGAIGCSAGTAIASW